MVPVSEEYNYVLPQRGAQTHSGEHASCPGAHIRERQRRRSPRLTPFTTFTLGNEPLENEPLGNETLGNDSLGHEPVGNGQLGKEPLGNEQLGNESLGNESLGNETLRNEPLGHVAAVHNESTQAHNQATTTHTHTNTQQARTGTPAVTTRSATKRKATAGGAIDRSGKAARHGDG